MVRTWILGLTVILSFIIKQTSSTRVRYKCSQKSKIREAACSRCLLMPARTVNLTGREPMHGVHTTRARGFSSISFIYKAQLALFINLKYPYCMTRSEFCVSMIPPRTGCHNVPSSVESLVMVPTYGGKALGSRKICKIHLHKYTVSWNFPYSGTMCVSTIWEESVNFWVLNLSSPLAGRQGSSSPMNEY